MLIFDEFFRNPRSSELELIQSVLADYASVIDEGIRTGSSAEFIAMLSTNMPPPVEERIASMLAPMVGWLRRANMHARADWVQKVWIEQSTAADRLFAEGDWQKFTRQPQAEAFSCRLTRVEIPPPDEDALVRHFMKTRKIASSPHTAMVMASNLSVRNKFVAVEFPDLFQSCSSSSPPNRD